MKILQVGKFYHPSFGGIETVLKNISEGLVKRGHEVTVLCFSHTGVSSSEQIEGVRVLRTSSIAKIASQPLSSEFAIKLNKLASEHDAVHLHTPNPLAELVSLILPRNLPKIVSYHSDVVRQKWLLPFYLPLQKRFLNNADRIVVATVNHIDHSSVLGEFRSKCKVIPYGLDEEDFVETEKMRKEAERLREKHGPYVLFVGRLVGYKGISELIKAMKEVQAKCLVIGDGPLEEELKKQAKDLGIQDKIKLLGRIANIAPYYLGSELFVLPSISKNEAFGVVQLEAMAWGKPTIFTALDSGVTLVNQDGITGIQVPPKDSKALAQAIQSLLSDPRLKEKMGTAARARFLENFTRCQMVEKYESIYQELASEAKIRS